MGCHITWWCYWAIHAILCTRAIGYKGKHSYKSNICILISFQEKFLISAPCGRENVSSTKSWTVYFLESAYSPFNTVAGTHECWLYPHSGILDQLWLGGCYTGFGFQFTLIPQTCLQVTAWNSSQVGSGKILDFMNYRLSSPSKFKYDIRDKEE